MPVIVSFLSRLWRWRWIWKWNSFQSYKLTIITGGRIGTKIIYDVLTIHTMMSYDVNIWDITITNLKEIPSTSIIYAEKKSFLQNVIWTSVRHERLKLNFLFLVVTMSKYVEQKFRIKKNLKPALLIPLIKKSQH